MRPSPPRAQQGGERSSRGPEPRGHVTPAACGRLRPPGAAPTSVLDALSSTDSHLSLQSGGWLCRTPTCSGPGGRQLRALKLRFKASTAGRGPAWSGKRLGVFRRLCAHPAGPGQAPAGRPGRAGVSCGVGRPRGASVSHLESPEGAERSRGAHLQPALCPPPTVRTPRVQGEAADDSQDWQGPPRLCRPVPVTVLTPAGRDPAQASRRLSRGGHAWRPHRAETGRGTAQRPPVLPPGDVDALALCPGPGCPCGARTDAVTLTPVCLPAGKPGAWMADQTLSTAGGRAGRHAGRGPSGHLLPTQGPRAVSAGEGHTAQQPPRVPHGPPVSLISSSSELQAPHPAGSDFGVTSGMGTEHNRRTASASGEEGLAHAPTNVAPAVH